MTVVLRRIFIWFLPLACAGLLAGAASAADRPPPDLAAVLAKGEMRVGVALYPPWAMRHQDELRGFEVDVARQLAADMGVKPVFLTFGWDELISALTSGKIDIIIAGLTITPDRALSVNFSQPYASSGIGIATNIASTESLESLADLNDPAITIATVRGTVSERVAQRLFPKARFRQFADSDAAARELVEGKVSALVAANPVPRFVALNHPGEVDEPVQAPLVSTREAFAVRKGDPDFLAFLNSWIVARETDAWLAARHDYWFRSMRWRREGPAVEP